MAVRQHERAAVERARGTRAPSPRREEGGLLAAQRLVGNLAVQRLVAARGHDATAAGPTLLRAVAAVQRQPAPAPAPAPAPDPLADARIAWIDALPVEKRATIDGLGGPLTTRVRKLEAKLAKADQAGDDAAGAAARTELDTIKRKNASDWFTHRTAFMDYMGCTLGGDAGVRRYWEALTTWGDEWGFVVHPEVARRLDRVKAELAQHGVPMPQTTVGQSLRGDHTANKRERKSPGMMSHAMGVAADWFAYKNVHLTDERLMRVISAVTGGPHHMRLPKGGLSTITAMGEASMGSGTVDPAKAQEVIDTIGAEFDRLQAASDRLTTSLSTPKEEVLALQSALAPLADAAEKAKEAWQKAKPAQKAEKKAAFNAAQAAVDAKEAELKPRLEALFAPWLTALDQKAKEIEKAAADRGVRLDEVTTGQTLKAKREALVASAAPAKKALAKVAVAAKGAGTRAAGVRGAAAGAVAFLGSGKAPRGATADQLGTWPGTVGGIVQRAAAAVSDASRLKEEAELLSGAAPTPLGAGKDAKPAFRGERDLGSWAGTLDTAGETLRSAAKDLEAAAAALPPGQRDAAQELARPRRIQRGRDGARGHREGGARPAPGAEEGALLGAAGGEGPPPGRLIHVQGPVGEEPRRRSAPRARGRPVRRWRVLRHHRRRPPQPEERRGGLRQAVLPDHGEVRLRARRLLAHRRHHALRGRGAGADASSRPNTARSRRPTPRTRRGRTRSSPVPRWRRS